MLEASEKMHNKPVVDNPLSLAEVTAFMAMEVKLQSSLTEQNAKFLKVCVPGLKLGGRMVARGD